MPGFFNVISLVVRTSNPDGIARPLTRFLRTVDPRITPRPVETLDRAIQAPLAKSKTQALLSGSFAVVALILAASGLYGTIRNSEDARRREYAIRAALGEDPARRIRTRLSRSVRAPVGGLVCGIVLALGAGRLLHSLLFGIPRVDSVSLVESGGVLLLVALLASLASLCATAQMDPSELLRSM